MEAAKTEVRAKPISVRDAQSNGTRLNGQASPNRQPHGDSAHALLSPTITSLPGVDE